jgi:hypothetical protein
MPTDLYAAPPVVSPGRNPQPVPPKRPDPCADDTPVCPACGGLQCLCRPRFFPGQLLTDEDLNRLERYVVDKNKLHARYLHGWGVACGLEVVCDPCTTSNVVVRTGYALSPCGDDIIVCKDQSVNVCELIDQCRPQTGVVCDPPYNQPPRECRDGTEPWVLAICYDERPTRGITALTGSTDTACCSSCTCGGSGSCGCGGSAKKASAKVSGKKAAYQPQCEPTQICEGYRFVAYKRPPQTPAQLPPGRAAAGNVDLIFAWMYANRAKFGPLLERVLCCVTAALELQASFSDRGKYTSGQDAANAYVDYLDALRDFAASFALHNCTFLDKLTTETADLTPQVENLRKAAALDETQKALLTSALQRLDYNLFDLIAECFCSALLPACPPPAPDNCVPLALLTVRTRDCHVVQICNWEARKLLITWQTVGYWLSWLPWQRLRLWISRLCCADTPRRTIIWPLMLIIGMVLNQARAMQVRMAATANEAPLKEAVAADNLMAHLAQGFDSLRSGEDPAAPEWASLLARFADGSALSSLAGPTAVTQAQLEALKGQLGLDELRQQVEALQGTLKEYKTNVDGLRNFIVRGPGG